MPEPLSEEGGAPAKITIECMNENCEGEGCIGPCLITPAALVRVSYENRLLWEAIGTAPCQWCGEDWLQHDNRQMFGCVESYVKREMTLKFGAPHDPS
jgi:hypothetical protein